MNDDNPNRSLEFRSSDVSWTTAEFIETPPPRLLNLYIYLMVLLSIASITFCYFVKIPVKVEVQGSISTKDPAIPIVAPQKLKVTAILIQLNQLVEKGDRIIISEGDISQEDFSKLLKSVTEIQSLVALMNKEQCKSSCITTLQLAIGKIKGLQVPTLARSRITELNEKVLDSIARIKELDELPLAVSEDTRLLAQTKDKLRRISAQNGEKLLKFEVEQLKNTAGRLASQIQNQKRFLQNNLSRSSASLAAHVSDLIPFLEELNSGVSVVAPVSGQITALSPMAPGVTLAPGSPICEIMPTKSDLIGVVKISNQDISKVDPGMNTIIKIKALPEITFGVLNGKVSGVDAKPQEPNLPAAAAAAAQSPMAANFIGTYTARITLSSQSLSRAGTAYPLKPGMLFEGSIVTERISILRYLWREILNFY